MMISFRLISLLEPTVATIRGSATAKLSAFQKEKAGTEVPAFVDFNPDLIHGAGHCCLSDDAGIHTDAAGERTSADK
jgi:hypothetical protein